MRHGVGRRSGRLGQHEEGRRAVRAALLAAATRSRPRARRARRPRSPTASASTGPNFNVRKACDEDALYAIQNGGYSGAIMPANIVVGQDANDVARFIAEYSGKQAEETLAERAGLCKPPRRLTARRRAVVLDLKQLRADPDAARAALARRGAAERRRRRPRARRPPPRADPRRSRACARSRTRRARRSRRPSRAATTRTRRSRRCARSPRAPSRSARS